MSSYNPQPPCWCVADGQGQTGPSGKGSEVRVLRPLHHFELTQVLIGLEVFLTPRDALQGGSEPTLAPFSWSCLPEQRPPTLHGTARIGSLKSPLGVESRLGMCLLKLVWCTSHTFCLVEAFRGELEFEYILCGLGQWKICPLQICPNPYLSCISSLAWG